MLARVIRRTVALFSKIKVQEIQSKSYQQLVDLVAKRYGNREFKHLNAAALYEIQHHFNIINSGDWILDIGAGPKFRWTDLALTLAENQELSHQVIANDRLQKGICRPNTHYIAGNFLEEPVRTKIALALGDRQFDTILADVSPEYTGELENDSAKIIQVLQEGFYFSNLFLKKGGNFVCKVLKSNTANILQETGRIFFHQAYSYKPSVIRPRSPVYYLVFKGFAMNHNLQALREFLSKYRGSPKNKIAVVQNYQGKYTWDPVKMLQQKAKNDYLALKMQGRSDRDILLMFKDDPFIKISTIARQFNLMQKAKMQKNEVALKKAMYQFTDGKMCGDYAQVPTSREEWIDFLEGIENKLKAQAQSKKKKQPKKNNLEPLGDNQVYMKGSQKQQQEEQQCVYIEEDLTGEYDIRHEQAYVQRELAKIQKLSLDQDDDAETLRQLGEKRPNLRKFFSQQTQIDDPDNEVKDLKESFQAMTDDEFMKILQQEDGPGYQKEIEENMGKSLKGSRNKFKNR